MLNGIFKKALTNERLLNFGTALVHMIIASAPDNPFGVPFSPFGSSFVTSQTQTFSRPHFTSFINFLALFSVRTSPTTSKFGLRNRDEKTKFPVLPPMVKRATERR